MSSQQTSNLTMCQNILESSALFKENPPLKDMVSWLIQQATNRSLSSDIVRLLTDSAVLASGKNMEVVDASTLDIKHLLLQKEDNKGGFTISYKDNTGAVQVAHIKEKIVTEEECVVVLIEFTLISDNDNVEMDEAPAKHLATPKKVLKKESSSAPSTLVKKKPNPKKVEKAAPPKNVDRNEKPWHAISINSLADVLRIMDNDIRGRAWPNAALIYMLKCTPKFLTDKLLSLTDEEISAVHYQLEAESMSTTSSLHGSISLLL